jgi:pimeloyl-ACP methyl ester carboxylesterase
MARERDEKTQAEVEAYMIERARQQEEGRRIVQENIARTKADLPETIRAYPVERSEKEVVSGSDTIQTFRYVSDREREQSSAESVLFPGWGTKGETYDQFSEQIAKRGHTITTIELGHGIETNEESEYFKQATLRKAAAAEEALDQLFPEEKKLDLIGHSEGGLVAIAHALRHPEHIRSITLVNSAGLLGKDDSLLKLSGRYVRDMVRDRWITLLRGGDTPGTLRHPVRSMQEASAIARTSNIVDILRTTRDRCSHFTNKER